MKRIWFPVILLGAGCSPFEPPDGTVRMDPPATYIRWYQETAACVGSRGHLERVTWWAVPAWTNVGDGEGLETLGFDCPTGICLGLWLEPHDIYLIDGYESERIVKHESLHDILQREDHRHPAFETCDTK